MWSLLKKLFTKKTKKYFVIIANDNAFVFDNEKEYSYWLLKFEEKNKQDNLKIKLNFFDANDIESYYKNIKTYSWEKLSLQELIEF